MSNDREFVGKFLIVTNLFIVTPLILLSGLYAVYNLYIGTFDISTLSPKGKLGLAILFIGGPCMAAYSFHYCRENFGWFNKK